MKVKMSKLRFLALAFAIASALLTPVKAQAITTDPCSYLGDARVSATLHAAVLHDALSSRTCMYGTTRGPLKLVFVTVIARDLNGLSPTAIFTSWLQQAKGYAQPIPGRPYAYTIGTGVVALDGGSVIRTNVYAAGESREALRKASLRLTFPILQDPK